MTRAHIDASSGATGEMLLGALVDAGASVEHVDDAVRTLGMGAVRLSWARVRRGERAACVVRVRAPERTPQLPSWSRVADLLAYAALPDRVRDTSLACAEQLVTAEAAAVEVEVADLELEPVGVLDMLAVVVGVSAAVEALALDDVTVGPVGVGTGTVETLGGAIEVPRRAVRCLLSGFELLPHPVAAELTTATGAALLATIGRPGVPAEGIGGPTGLGAGDRQVLTDAVLQVQLA